MDTLQSIFDTVARHLIRQGAAAVDGGKCCYRTTTGLKCAAGCLIPDEEYDELTFEGRLVHHIPWFHQNFPSREEMTLIAQLQNAHDVSLVHSTTLKMWKERMRSIADRYGLSAEVLN